MRVRGCMWSIQTFGSLQFVSVTGADRQKSTGLRHKFADCSDPNAIRRPDPLTPNHEQLNHYCSGSAIQMLPVVSAVLKTSLSLARDNPMSGVNYFSLRRQLEFPVNDN
jgi:hypothetical protein